MLPEVWILALLLGVISCLVLPRASEPSDLHLIFPVTTYTYDVSTGSIDCEGTRGFVYKSTSGNGRDKTALLSFSYPLGVVGRNCALIFSLDGVAASGSLLLDVYTSFAPAPGCTSDWNPGNGRDQDLGRVQLVPSPGSDGDGDGIAVWVATYSNYLTKSGPCMPPGTVQAFELVGVNDDDEVVWDPSVGGLQIIVS